MTGLPVAPPGVQSRRLVAGSEGEALEVMHAQGWTDGLPVVVPTPERVEAMLTFCGGLDRDVVLGAVGPADGEATVEKVAVNAVMAGCLPEHFPVVLAAVEAVVDPAFNLGAVQSTTHCAGPTIIVNGPARFDCGPISSGTGALGPGHRANAAIGRALRLVMMNVGGGRPGTGDMALLGQPGKFTSCLAEAEEASPFEPLHVSRGLPAEDGAVTVLATEAPHSAICLVDPETDDNADRLLRVLAAALANPAANPVHLRKGMNAVILNPEHAAELARAGMGRAEVQQRLHELARWTRGALRPLGGPLVEPGDDEDELCVVRDPEDLVIVVAGGPGLYSMVLPSWGGGPEGNLAVTKPVRWEKPCDVPLSRESAISATITSNVDR